MPIECRGPVILGMNRKGTHTDDVGDLESAPESVEQQPSPDAAALCLAVHSQARKHQQRNRMPRHTFADALRSLCVLNFARNDRVETDDLAAAHRNVSL